MAGIGPVPIMDGSTPTCDQETNVPRDSNFRSLHSLSVVKIRAAAPSLIPEALPGVTVPFPS